MTEPEPAWLGEPAPAPLPGPDQLAVLIHDAARRATAILGGAPDPRDEDPLSDAIRILAQAPGLGRQQAIASNAGLAEIEVRRRLLAFRHGGPPGVRAACEATMPSDDLLDHAFRQVADHVPAARLELGDGTITDPAAGVQVRYGADARWYPFTFSQQRWWPAPGATPQASAAYAAAMRAKRAR
jgi:hypothetical protein